MHTGSLCVQVPLPTLAFLQTNQTTQSSGALLLVSTWVSPADSLEDLLAHIGKHTSTPFFQDWLRGCLPSQLRVQDKDILEEGEGTGDWGKDLNSIAHS